MRPLQALLVGAGLLLVPLHAEAQRADCQCADDDDIEESVPTSNGRLGLFVMHMTPELREHLGADEDSGVLVARVKSASPAALAGVEVGDVIVEISGRDIDSASDIAFEVAQATTSELPIQVIRNGKSIELRATLPEELRRGEPEVDWPAIDLLRKVEPITPGGY